ASDPKTCEQRTGGLADHLSMAIKRYGHRDDCRPKKKVNELCPIKISFVRSARDSQHHHNQRDGEEGRIEQRHLVATFVHRNGNEVGAECQAQQEQRRGGEKLQPANQSIGAHDWAVASTASMPRGDSLVTTRPVTATVAQTETNRTRRM